MKLLLLLLMTITLALSSERKILLGSYANNLNASKALIQANDLVEKDALLKHLINVNSLEIKKEKIGNYYAITISYLKTYTQLFRTLKAFSKYYHGAYVLPPYKEEIANKEKLPSEKETMSKKEILYKTTIKIRIVEKG